MPDPWKPLMLAVATTLLVGCGGTSHLQVATPTIYAEDAADPFANTPDSAQGNTCEIFFATDRRPTPEDDDGPAYGDRIADGLRVGTAEIRFGGDASWGEVVAASRAGPLLDADVAELVSTNELGMLTDTISPIDAEFVDTPSADDAFAAAINERLAESRRKDIFIFVPGYKVDFEFPLTKGVQWWHFMGRDGVFLPFAWVSRLGRLDYLGDVELSIISSRSLRILVEFLATRTDARRIHILAHSAGTRVALEALVQLNIAYDGQAARDLRLGQVIIAGSEMSLPAFAVYYADGMQELAERMTIYTSQEDAALGLSGWLFKWIRLGTLDGSQLDEAGAAFLRETPDLSFVDVTDAENATAGNGHWYLTSSPWVVSDILLQFQYELAPADRGLVEHPDGPTWIFPEDYPERVRRIIRASQPTEREAAP